MMPVPPYPVIPGDSESRIMARSLQIRGWSKTHVVWVGGFLPGSEQAGAHYVQSDDFHWYLCTLNGTIVSEFVGFALELPKEFRRVLEYVVT